jgi:hypothetical protein
MATREEEWCNVGGTALERERGGHRDSTAEREHYTQAKGCREDVELFSAPQGQDQACVEGERCREVNPGTSALSSESGPW